MDEVRCPCVDRARADVVLPSFSVSPLTSSGCSLQMAGIDVFDQKPLKLDRMGTMQDPIQVNSVVSPSVVCVSSSSEQAAKGPGGRAREGQQSDFGSLRELASSSLRQSGRLRSCLVGGKPFSPLRSVGRRAVSGRAGFGELSGGLAGRRQLNSNACRCPGPTPASSHRTNGERGRSQNMHHIAIGRDCIGTDLRPTLLVCLSRSPSESLDAPDSPSTRTT